MVSSSTTNATTTTITNGNAHVDDCSKQKLCAPFCSSPFSSFTSTSNRWRIRLSALIMVSFIASLLPDVTAGEGGERMVSRINPPPPPPPRRGDLSPPKISVDSVESNSHGKKMNPKGTLISSTAVIPPPPPPPPPPSNTKNETDKKDIDKKAANNEDITMNKRKPPPPPRHNVRSQIKQQQKPKLVENNSLSPKEVDGEDQSASVEGEKRGNYVANSVSNAQNDGARKATPSLSTMTKVHSHTDDHTSQSIASGWYQQHEPDRYQYELNNPKQQQHDQPNRDHYGIPSTGSWSSSYQSSRMPSSQQRSSSYSQQSQQWQKLPAHAATWSSSSKASPPSSSDAEVSSFIKSIWGRVGRGLDELANLEDSVTGRAQQFVNFAVTAASSSVTKMSPSAIRSLAQPGASANNVASASSANIRPFGKKTEYQSSARRTGITTNMATPVSVPLRPYGQKYQIAREEKERLEQQKQLNAEGAIDDNSIPNIFSKKNSTKMGFNDLLLSGKSKLMSAKGGASYSPYYPQQQAVLPSGDDDGSGGGIGSGDDSSAGIHNQDKAVVEEVNTGRSTSSDISSNDNSSYSSSTSFTLTPPQESTSPNSIRNGSTKTNNSRTPSSSWESQQSTSTSMHQESSSGSPGGGAPSFSGQGTYDSSNNNSPYTGNENPRDRSDSWDNRQMHDPSRSQPQQQGEQQRSRSSRIPWDVSPASYSSHSKGQNSLSTTKITGSIQSSAGSANMGSYTNSDDDYEKPDWKKTIKRLIPPLPSFPSIRNLFRRNRNDKYAYASFDLWESTDKEEQNGVGGFFGRFFAKSRSDSSALLPSTHSSFRHDRDERTDQPPLLSSMLSRCDDGKTISLLGDSDVRAGSVIGRYQAFMDVLSILSVILGFKLMAGFEDLLFVPKSFQDLNSVILPKAAYLINELMMGSWSFFAFLYAYLFKYVREKLIDQRVDNIASKVASYVKEESEYAQLYLRLMAAIPMDRNLPDRLASICKKEVASVVSKARLHSYVGIVSLLLIVTTFSGFGPVLMEFSSTFAKLALLQEWREWPVPWKRLFGASSTLLKTLSYTMKEHSSQAFKTFVDSPMQFSFHLSMFASLIMCSLLPQIEERRAVASVTNKEDLEEELATSNFESAEEWSRLGTSSASRLSMLSENGSVENALARWRASRITPLDDYPSKSRTLSSLIRLVTFTVAGAIMAGLPLLVSHLLAVESPSLHKSLSILRWNSLFDLSFIQIFLFVLVHQALQKVMESSEHAAFVKDFQTDLVSTKKEIEDSNKRQSDFQLMGSVSPSAGMAVRDLWAAHASKRAWAVRGANLQCKNGEILAILGDDGNGKTRLLTTLAEALTFPPKRTTTAIKVRGYIAICGLELSKWDHKMLKRRLGILLSDVRMIADSASLFSGWTMEEILEPVDGLQNNNNNPMERSLSSAEKSSMLLALKITGLYGTLLARLPAKLSTIFTANEEDLRPTSQKPRSIVLSPGEWSKLILARVLTQTIYDNDNALASNDKIDNSLVGSILLLDEPTMMYSEVEEGQLFQELRRTGAATVITTNKWATGRFADRICVVRNGSILETGSHNELIARGPQQSLYAAKWHAMTIQ